MTFAANGHHFLYKEKTLQLQSFGYRTEVLTSQIAGNWESTPDNPYSRKSQNRRVHQPLCESKFFQDAR